MRLGNARPDVLHEVGHAVDIGNGTREARRRPTVRPSGRRVGGARLVVLDVCRIGNDGRAGAGDFVEQALLICPAAQVDAVGITIGSQFFAPQLAPIDPGVEAADQAAAGAGILSGEVVVDVVRVHDQGRELLAWWSLTQVAMAKEGELQVDDVEPLGAQNFVESLLHLRHHDPQPLEARLREPATGAASRRLARPSRL